MKWEVALSLIGGSVAGFMLFCLIGAIIVFVALCIYVDHKGII
jgi:hypothetical protein